MTNDKTFAELEAQSQATFIILTTQRNGALSEVARQQDIVANLMGQIAILEKRIEGLTEAAKAESPPPVPGEKGEVAAPASNSV